MKYSVSSSRRVELYFMLIILAKIDNVSCLMKWYTCCITIHVVMITDVHHILTSLLQWQLIFTWFVMTWKRLDISVVVITWLPEALCTEDVKLTVNSETPVIYSFPHIIFLFKVSRLKANILTKLIPDTWVSSQYCKWWWPADLVPRHQQPQC